MHMVIEATELVCGQRTITASQMGSGDQTQMGRVALQAPITARPSHWP